MRDREALHIYFTHKERQLYAFFWGGLGVSGSDVSL